MAQHAGCCMLSYLRGENPLLLPSFTGLGPVRGGRLYVTPP